MNATNTGLDANDFMLWQQSLKRDSAFNLSTTKYPKLSVSFDMGWQQRSSGNRYASPSGHVLFVGGRSRKPILLVIKSKMCNFCSSWKKKDNPLELPMPVHKCLKNHDGSSSSMEPSACLEMTINLYQQKHCTVNFICVGDDALTRALVRWSNADYMMNNNTSEPPKVFVTRGKNKGKKMQPRPDQS